jgi:hypothetical protein
MSAPWRALRRLLIWLVIAASGLAALALLLFGAAFLINTHDEPLSAQARTLLVPLPNPYKPADNVYLAIEGFDAPAGESVIAAGAARIERYNRSVDTALRDPSPARLTGLGAQDAHRLQFAGDISFVQPLTTSVWQAAPEHEAQIRKLLADNGELYRRYLDLLPLRGYYETARPSGFAPYPLGPGDVHRLFLAVTALHMRSPFAHERARALADLQLDAQLWRAVFSGEGTLVSKMVATAFLQADELLLADMIADPDVALPQGEQDADALVPVRDLTDWDLGSAFAAEFRVSSSMLRQTGQLAANAWVPDTLARSGVSGWLNRLDSRIEGHFFKLHASENLFARQTLSRMGAAGDPSGFLRSRSTPHGLFPEGESLWAHAYNPLGKVLAAIADPAYDNYLLRAWDAAALERLVRLSYEIRRARIDPGAIPAFLRQHAEWSTHPADQRPFLWDAARGELRVQTLARQSPGRRFSVSVWKPALAPPAPPR